jgi:hypothetical protein
MLLPSSKSIQYFTELLTEKIIYRDVTLIEEKSGELYRLYRFAYKPSRIQSLYFFYC